jgi:hypothetical protein
MRRDIINAIARTRASCSLNEVNAAVKASHDSGINAAYSLTRKMENQHTRQPEFCEVLIVPSEVEMERIGLDNRAISEGWL